jgi:hypothetical protein
MEPLDPGCCSPGSPVMVVWEPGGYLLTVGAVSLPLRLRKGRWWVLPPGASYRSRGTGPFTTLASATRAGRNLLVYGLATELCRALTPEAVGQLVTVLCSIEVCDVVELRIEVRREVG